MTVKENGTELYTLYYFGSYERTEYANSTYKENYYLYGTQGMIGVHQVANNTDKIIYALNDVQGSLMALVDEQGDAILEELSYDAWGRRRNPANWTFNNIPAPNLLSRGYTMHEHIDEVNLINMNGRVYDPRLALFLSPDPVIQLQDDPLNYNRYSYVMNNPLKYTDPSGYYMSREELYERERGGSVGSGMWAPVDYGDWVVSQMQFHQPQWFKLDGARSQFDYDLLVAQELNRITGTTWYTDYVWDNINNYNLSDRLTSNLVRVIRTTHDDSENIVADWYGSTVVGKGITVKMETVIKASSSGGWNNYIAPMDNTRIDPSYLARGGNPGSQHYIGGYTITQDGFGPSPRLAPFELKGNALGNVNVGGYSPSAFWQGAAWIAGGLMRIADPSTDLSTISNGDTAIWMDGGYSNHHPVMSIVKITTEDTVFTNNYHYPSNQLIFKYGD